MDNINQSGEDLYRMNLVIANRDQSGEYLLGSNHSGELFIPVRSVASFVCLLKKLCDWSMRFIPNIFLVLP